MEILISPYLYLNNYKKICFSINKEWIDFFRKTNLEIKIITYHESKKKFDKKLFKNCKGLIISGGGDIYKIKKNHINYIRDFYEKELIKKAIQYKIPILCVCRGFQLLGDMMNFKSIKDSKHLNTSHKIFFINQKKNNGLHVNSYHRNKIINLSKNFKAVALATDGSIEIARSENNKILCCMFHPERKSKNQREINLIIKNFFKIK